MNSSDKPDNAPVQPTTAPSPEVSGEMFFTDPRFRSAAEVVFRFAELLKEEKTLGTSGDVDGLLALIERKKQLMDSLAAMEPGLSDGLRDTESAEADELKRLLRECLELNRQNRIVVHTEIRHTRNALKLLRSVMKLDDLTLYNAEGELKIAREKRHLGSV